MTKSFETWFAEVAAETPTSPHAWQAELGNEPTCRDRFVRIPTGFGKTAGVVLAWLYHRVVRNDDRWPRRLVFCLPMRVLVEQSERAIRAWLDRAGAADVKLHVLMGGVETQRWVEDPDAPAILVGTQDMLLSRALNRGYGAGRALWPMEYGLLHQDALWVLDEVQLMDVGLATSAQLAAFRDQDVAMGRARLRPVHTWWMSATLQPRWLGTVDRPAPTEPAVRIPRAQRRGGLFEVKKPLERASAWGNAADIAKGARERHVPGTLSLVIVNRVTTAIDVYDALVAAYTEGKGKKQRASADAPEIKLVHSRFRGHERAQWAEAFLRRDAEPPPTGRIIVATQVVEAGVDISARTLIAELAPWSSLVQRFGRAARYAGETATVLVAGAVPADDKAAAPYRASELAAAAEALVRLAAHEGDASPRSLEAFEEDLEGSDAAFLARLYPYEPLHVLRRRDLDDLFDTSADLSGADLDVSRFIRSGEERDVSVFWRDIDKARSLRLAELPRREELCPVPIGDIRKWPGDAYVLDYLDDAWVQRAPGRLVPGMTVLLDAAAGGYTVERGWVGKSGAVPPVERVVTAEDHLVTASFAEDNDYLSFAPWKTVATHGKEAEAAAADLCDRLGLAESVAAVVKLAARWHDAGKVHPTFQAAITRPADAVGVSQRSDLAKAPDDRWRRPPYPDRPGFRHELASTLALFELLRRFDPLHPALLGAHRELLDAMGTEVEPVAASDSLADHPLVTEIVDVIRRDPADFDLLAWLVCTHHGKVRCVWTSTPRDQDRGKGGIHGIWEGDLLPSFDMAHPSGRPVPAVALSLSPAAMGVGTRYGASWGERVARLVARHGPFGLAFLEAVLRVADWRASGLKTGDPLL